MTTTVRTLIVDDVALARQKVRRALLRHPDIEVVGEAEDGTEMRSAIERYHPALVFLDVSMPQQDGFSALLDLPASDRPLVVFVTAFAEHAVRAFRVEAVDYLLKPLDSAAVSQALDRVRQRLALRQQRPPVLPVYPNRIAFKTSDGLTVMQVDQVVWIEAIRNYVAVHAAEKTVILRATLQDTLDRFDPAIFARVHRSTAVNTSRIQQLSALTNGDQRLLLDTGKELVVSRSYRQSLLACLAVRS